MFYHSCLFVCLFFPFWVIVWKGRYGVGEKKRSNLLVGIHGGMPWSPVSKPSHLCIANCERLSIFGGRGVDVLQS